MNVAAILKDKGRSVVTATPEATLLEVAGTLTRYAIGCVVLTRGDGGIAGIMSERDIVRMIARGGAKMLDEPVSKHMTRKVVTCRMSDTIDRLMGEMTAGRFRHLPVIEDGELVGIVSIGDVVKQRIAEAEMEAAAMRQYIATG